MCMYFFAHAFVRNVFMFRLAPTIYCILTSILIIADQPYLVCEVLQTEEFSAHLYSYIVKIEDRPYFVSHRNCQIIIHTISTHYSYCATENYIIFRKSCAQVLLIVSTVPYEFHMSR